MREASQTKRGEIVDGRSCGRGFGQRVGTMRTTLVTVAAGTILCAGAVYAQDPVRIESVQVQVEFIAVPKPDGDALLRAEAGGIPSKDRILDLVKQGKAKVVCAPSVTTMSGQEAQVKSVEEYIYPTSLDIQPPQTNTASAGAPQLIVVSPADFQTREVGVILHCTPEVSEKGDIHISLTSEVVAKPTWKIYKAKCFAADGKEREIDFEQPFFQSQSLSTSLVVKDGEMVIGGGGLPDPSGEAVTFMMVTARRVDASGSPRNKKETVEPAAGTKRAAP